MAKEIRSVSDIVPDLANANKGTERGRYAVEASLRETGAGRSIVVDREGRIIAGNKTLESWADISGDIEIVKTDGTKLVVVQREDLDLEDVEGLARKLAYYDNRSSELGLAWDPEILLADINAGVDLSGMFFEHELNVIMGMSNEANNPYDEWKGMPEFEQEDLSPFRSIRVNFKTIEDIQAFAELVGQKLTDKTRSIWYPEAKIDRYANKRWVDES